MIDKQIRKLRTLGFKITPQRRAVLDFLDGNTSHPTANDIYEGLKKNDPEISLATVYNTVELLAANGLLLELPISKNKLNYDPDTSQHDHAYCTDCGKIIDIFPQKKNGDRSDRIENFQIRSVRKIYYGKCGNCQNKEESL
jgi:Fur family transcriptional regulator, peroxide stress response regulator